MNEPLSQRVLRGDLFSEHCASRDVLKHVTSRWGMLLLVALRDGAQRFGALRRKVGGISERMLAQTLVWLQDDGFVQRIEHSMLPPHVEYRLTPLGEDFAGRVGVLLDWIELNLGDILEARHRVAGETTKNPSDGTSQGVRLTGPAGGH